jgi:putative DNA primase/helicase
VSRADRIGKALGGRQYHGYWAVRCPVHDDHNPSCIVRDGDEPETLLVRCYAGCDARAILNEFRRQGLLGGDAFDRRLHEPAARPNDEEGEQCRRILAARRIWRQASATQGTLAETYLAARGIDPPAPPTLRYAPSLPHAPSGMSWPAMIAAVAAPDGSICGIHRIYLAAGPPRKAPIVPVKMSFGPISRGAVRLGAATCEIGISEGIETGLAFQQAERIPTWAALSISGMRSVVLPRHPLAATVHLIVDADPAGESAALAAAERFAAEGRAVKLARPRFGKDMNDSLRGA